MSSELDLGSGVTLRFVCWAPDRELNPQHADLPNVERYGATIEHPWAAAETGRCLGAVIFDGEVAQRLEPNKSKWTVESWDPLTLSPSILCQCGFHGFIRGGRWVSA